jgi:hypothetical protein
MLPVDDAAVARALRTFAGAMLGLAAHELNNRLAVMRETVGLLEDLARAGKSAAAGTARAHASLDDQVGRAVNIVRTLTERWARQHALTVQLEIAGNLPRAAGDPALFLCLTHRLLLRCAAGLQSGGNIILRVGRHGDGVACGVYPPRDRDAGATAPNGDDAAIDLELARRLGGELVCEGGGAPTIRLAAFR